MRIMIAEDEPVSRHLVERFLVQWGYEVVAVNDGDEAWVLLQQPDAPRLAILDWMMPGKDGVEICREVRKRVAEPYVYIILLTAKSQKADIVAGLEAGADDYLTKPFDPDELRVRLRAGRRILDLMDHLLCSRDAMRFPATHDLLTGVWNREAILGMLRQKLAHKGADGSPLGIILVNLDHYKQISQVRGPLVGDAALQETARRLRSGVRLYDSIGRYGAGEFLVVVPGCFTSETMELAEKLRQAIDREPMDLLGGAISVTCSLGVAATDELKGSDADLLLRAAEAAVGRAKLRGRNRVEQAEAADLPGLESIADVKLRRRDAL
ncbi:MAG: diguanylate cyclase [Acidobacteria bacterium]|nr:diguanylate cyclase [Acidobacteriota bacterium]